MTKSDLFIGFDPGLSGGVAEVDADTAHAYPMPVAGGEIDVATMAEHFNALGETFTLVAIVEQVHSMPKQGVSSTFKFGKGYGKILGMLEALKIRTMLVTPQAWKAVILAGTPKDKDAAVAWCRRTFPNVSLVPTGCRVAHDGCADALCIGEYGRRVSK